MHYKTITTALFFCMALLLASCEREKDFIEEIEPQLKDSTLLIKSIEAKFYHFDIKQYVTVWKYFDYDTVAKTVTITLDDEANIGEWEKSKKRTFSYNDDGLLDSVIFHYINGAIPETNDPEFVSFSYDNDDALKEVQVKYKSGNSRISSLNKANFSDHSYSLERVFDWGQGNTYSDKNFIAADNNITYEDFFSHLYLEGSAIGYNYDSKRVLQSLMYYDLDAARKPVDSILAVEVFTRETKGGQYYDLERTILNGIFQYSDWLMDEITPSLGIGSLTFDVFRVIHHRYPAKTYRYYDFYLEQYISVTNPSVIDEKGRLLETQLPENDDDGTPVPSTIKISYFK